MPQAPKSQSGTTSVDPGMKSFHEMQVLQKKHDEGYHRDIYHLSNPNRMRHFALHFAKYTGRLANRDLKEPDLLKMLKVTSTDTFIIVLSATDVLNLDLDKTMEEHFGKPKAPGVAGWVETVAPSGPKLELKALQEWWLHAMAAPTGRIAKAVESMDHIESLNARQVLVDALLTILESDLVASKHLGIDLASETVSRWAEVAEKRVL